jgi:hypothetical protein
MQLIDFVLGKRERACCLGVLTVHVGKRKGHPPSLLAFIPPLKLEGGVWVLDIFGLYPSFELSYSGSYSNSPLG